MDQVAGAARDNWGTKMIWAFRNCSALAREVLANAHTLGRLRIATSAIGVPAIRWRADEDTRVVNRRQAPPRRVCFVRHAYYPGDPRVRREAESLRAAGHEVDIICVCKEGQARRETINGINVYRLPIDHRRQSLKRYVYEYSAFFALAFVKLMQLHLRRRYAVVQVNTMPDFLVFVTAACKAMGASVMLDMHECVPELYQTTYGISPQHPMIRLLTWVEQRSMAFADQVTTCTPQQKELFVRRGTSAEKIAVVLDGVDTNLFRPQEGDPPRWQRGGDFVIISHGLVVKRYGHDTMVRAVALLQEEIPGLRLEVFGSGEYLPELTQLVRELGVEDRVHLQGFAPHEEMIRAIQQAHVGVVAAKRDVFRDLTLTNKMFEYVVMRKPVVIAETTAVGAHFDPACFGFFASDDPVDLARALRDLYQHPERVPQMIEAASRRYRQYTWEIQEEIYRTAVFGTQPPVPPTLTPMERAA